MSAVVPSFIGVYMVWQDKKWTCRVVTSQGHDFTDLLRYSLALFMWVSHWDRH